MGKFPIGSQNFTEDRPNHSKRISDSVLHIDTVSHSASSGARVSTIALTDVDINGQVTLIEPHNYTEEEQNIFRHVHDSLQHINTTSHSSFIKASLLSIPLTDTDVNRKVTVTEPHDYIEEGQNNNNNK